MKTPKFLQKGRLQWDLDHRPSVKESEMRRVIHLGLPPGLFLNFCKILQLRLKMSPQLRTKEQKNQTNLISYSSLSKKFIIFKINNQDIKQLINLKDLLKFYIFYQTKMSEWKHQWNQDDWQDHAQYEYVSQLAKQKSIQTQFGVIQVAPLDSPIQPGWRRLKLQEGKQIKQELNKLLGTWSIVAFERGKICGTGHGNIFEEEYGQQCGQMFIVQPK